MRKHCSGIFAAVILSYCAGGLSAAQNWQGAQVMPKSAEVFIQSDTNAPITLTDIQWPATVQETKGRLLRLRDDGGYSRNLAGGWIYADDVVRLDEARNHYSNELRRAETPWLYWMRGIVCESAGESGVAALDYENALALNTRNQLDDVHIRLGRLLAQQQLQGGHGKYSLPARMVWEEQFKAAQQINPNRPQLYYDWGLALSHACACTENRGRLTSLQKPLEASPVQPPVARGLDTNEERSSELPDPASRNPAPPSPKLTEQPTTTENSIPNPSTNAPPVNSNIAGSTMVGPTPAGGDAAVQALAYYEKAERLNPRWWLIPLARAELVLNECDQESLQGERVALNVKPEFLAQILAHCPSRSSRCRNHSDANGAGRTRQYG